MPVTQKLETLIYLQRYGSITPMDALKEFNCFRLGARIWDLRREGHDIFTEYETKRGKTYARYRLKRAKRRRAA